ncbi:alpha/beta hydrolase [Oharaeibacter diazotrophicus]|uniref:Phospholipase/carboxylesterase n=1 Tax=Oharaeibacter diazotrophicus TaxID=1920512 RepID=A0A4R6RFI4_9HYPH|nr:dienelactone hydrolase family protein [Oharaeibacter diazotrophicus]TDP85151.1 phospholipase/carboxylesterase [Oharaeibacter diazotrophicus]BBE74121.1 putative hydrolase [Pleomorphomonas sp. SM30]GLS76191.1 phospholipase/carboxylesterase [Oharaeibacter diazotrophicus]
MTTVTTTRGRAPHAGQRVHATGAALGTAPVAMILLHGRGATARDILMLAGAFEREDVSYLAPQAAGHQWYPLRFVEPTARNEPALSAALAVVDDLVADVAAAGVPPERTVVLGFSQGACLATEYAARRPRRYGGIVGLSGGLIGSDAEVTAHAGDLAGTPVILGCSDVDSHIPLTRVKATSKVLAGLGADVDETIYPGMGHGIVEDEVRRVRALLDALARTA